MKKLFLVRHAKSSWKNASLRDIERPLNKRGYRDAPFMGHLMMTKNIKPDLLIASPAVRANKTAEIFCEEINYPSEKIIIKNELYEASRKDILSVIQLTENNYQSLMLFAHNPGLTELVNYLADNNIDNVPTCATVGITSSIEDWNELDDFNCSLDFFEYPKMYFS